MASPRNRAISTCPFRPVFADVWPVTGHGTRSRMSLPAQERFVTRPGRVTFRQTTWAARHQAIGTMQANRSFVLFDSGDEVVVQAGDQGLRFLLVSGKPLEEPVAWYGPIVMNTREQLQQAIAELREGTFIRG